MKVLNEYKVSHIEYADWDRQDSEYILYGPISGHIDEERLDKTEISGKMINIDEYIDFNDIKDFYLVEEESGDIVLTDDIPEEHKSANSLENTEITVGFWEGESYIQIDNTWYGPRDSVGKLFIEWRKAESDKDRYEDMEYPNVPKFIPLEMEEYEITLYNVFGSGGSFWAQSENCVEFGDMPEEALDYVIFSERQEES